MTTLGKLTFRTRRTALVGMLLAVPLLPVAGCSDGGDGRDGGSTEVENDDTRDEDDDGGLY